MCSKSDNIETMIYDKKWSYQERFEISMKGNDFIFDFVNLLN